MVLQKQHREKWSWYWTREKYILQCIQNGFSLVWINAVVTTLYEAINQLMSPLTFKKKKNHVLENILFKFFVPIEGESFPYQGTESKKSMHELIVSSSSRICPYMLQIQMWNNKTLSFNNSYVLKSTICSHGSTDDY